MSKEKKAEKEELPTVEELRRDGLIEVTNELMASWRNGIKSKREVFKEVMTFIVDKNKKKDQLNDAWREYNPDGNYLSLDGDWETTMVQLLREYVGDYNDDIGYWLYELNYGEKAKKNTVTDKNGRNIPIKTIDDLYNLISS